MTRYFRTGPGDYIEIPFDFPPNTSIPCSLVTLTLKDAEDWFQGLESKYKDDSRIDVIIHSDFSIAKRGGVDD